MGGRWDAGLRDLGQADVARLGEQHGADADARVLGACAAAEVGERVGVVGPGADLQEHFGERDTIGQHRRGDRAEPCQLLGFIKRLELAEVGAVGAGDLGDVKRQVGLEALGGLPVGAVQLGAELIECPLWLRGEAQAGADLRPRCGPRGAAQQVGARVGEATRACNEHVAAMQRRLERLQDAEGICAPVELALAELRVGWRARAGASGR